MSDSQFFFTVFVGGMGVPILLVFLHDCVNYAVEYLQRRLRPDLYTKLPAQIPLLAKYRSPK